jgi:predicted transcriptional regulator
MSKRFEHLRRLGHLVYSTRMTYCEAYIALVNSLPDSHARAYRACQGDDPITSDYLVEWAGWEQNYASDILRELMEFGLLAREEIIDERGKHYVYWAREKNIPLLYEDNKNAAARGKSERGG